MFDHESASSEPRSLSEPAPDRPEPAILPPPPDPGALLAAVGLPSRAIREILGSADG